MATRTTHKANVRKGIDKAGIRSDDTVLTPAAAKRVRCGEAQLKCGDSKPWDAVKHTLSQ